MMWFEAYWRLVSVLADAGPTGLLVGTGAIAGILMIILLASGVLAGHGAAATDSQFTSRALRQRADRTGVPRHRDPDASGRTRPRGPTQVLAAA